MSWPPVQTLSFYHSTDTISYDFSLFVDFVSKTNSIIIICEREVMKHVCEIPDENVCGRTHIYKIVKSLLFFTLHVIKSTASGSKLDLFMNFSFRFCLWFVCQFFTLQPNNTFPPSLSSTSY